LENPEAKQIMAPARIAGNASTVARQQRLTLVFLDRELVGVKLAAEQ
jgi:hypothetical protein